MTRKALAWLKSPLVILIGLSVVGCANDNMRDLKLYVEQVKARKGGHIEPLPEIKQIETFVYKEDGRRSPFMGSRRTKIDARKNWRTTPWIHCGWLALCSKSIPCGRCWKPRIKRSIA
jgi:Tfp pilus assembly protein PilP